MLLLLALGLEFSSAEFTAALRSTDPAGWSTSCSTPRPGVLFGILLGLPPAGVVALAGITWISSSGIVARTLTDLGRLGYRETPSVLSILVLEDIAMAAYLPLLGVVLAGAGLAAGFVGMAVAVTTVTVVLVLAPRVGTGLDRRCPTTPTSRSCCACSD